MLGSRSEFEDTQEQYLQCNALYYEKRKNKDSINIIEQLCYKYTKEAKEQYFAILSNRIVFNAYSELKLKEAHGKSLKCLEKRKLEVIKSFSNAYCI